MKWPHSPLFIPVLLFTLGGVLSFLIPTALTICLRLGCLFVLFLFFTQIFKFLQPIQTLSIYSCFLWAGLLYFKAYYTPSPNHYQNLKEEDAQLKQIEIQSLVGSYSFSSNYVGKVMGIGSQKTTGCVLIRQVKDSTSKVWDSGQKIFTNQNFEAIKGPLNPGQFSYKNYLANKKIYHQLSLNSANSISTASQDLSLRSYAENLERNAFKKIEASTLSSSSQAMLKALLFADRNALEERIKKDYAHAGVIHLLALSGLHIGLLVGFLLFLLQPLKKFKYGALIQSFCIISLLWMFAFFIGFPPSVSRAVCMFSFMVIGRTLHYGKSTFHYTLLSFFVLLLCYPPYLRSVGFQLSYLALFGILLIHPLLQKLWIPKSRFLKRYWEWTTVCLAAQLAVSPISIYYFHQFPSLFLVSNLLIIPFFGLFLMVCVAVFCVLIFFSLPSNVVTFFDLMVKLLNGTVSRIAQQEVFLFDEIFFSTNTTLLLYLILIGLVFWGYQKKMWTFIPIGALLVVFWMILVYEQQIATSINSFWVFHRYNATLIGHQTKAHFNYFSSNPEQTQSLLTYFANSRSLSKTIHIELHNVYVQAPFTLLILTDDAPYELTDFEPEYILLRNNPKINVTRLLSRCTPRMLIADGSNAPWNIVRWKKSCQELGIPFYNTREEGALQISL